MNMPKTIARKPASWRGVTPIQDIVPGGTSGGGDDGYVPGLSMAA